MDLSREEFEQGYLPRRGTANPERMQVAFWDWMVRGPGAIPADDADADEDESDNDAHYRSHPGGYHPYQARRVFASAGSTHAPIWTAARMGMTRTALSDGRVVWIGGEHEDHYDPDFFIYNDVIVTDPAGEIAIFGYPSEVFPPTDFHTATLIEDRIWIIGCLGYPDDRRPGPTPVFALDPATWRIEPIAATGEAPGWLYEHEAEADGQGRITVRGGMVEDRENIDDYRFDPAARTWERLTRRIWRQYLIRQKFGGLFLLEDDPGREGLYPTATPHEVEPTSNWNEVRFRVEGLLVRVECDIEEIKIVIEGELPVPVADALVEEIRARVASAIGEPCVSRRV